MGPSLRRLVIGAALACVFASGCGLSGLLFWRDSGDDTAAEETQEPPAPGACKDGRYYPEGTRLCREHRASECRDGRWVVVATC